MTKAFPSGWIEPWTRCRKESAACFTCNQSKSLKKTFGLSLPCRRFSAFILQTCPLCVRQIQCKGCRFNARGENIRCILLYLWNEGLDTNNNQHEGKFVDDIYIGVGPWMSDLSHSILLPSDMFTSMGRNVIRRYVSTLFPYIPFLLFFFLKKPGYNLKICTQASIAYSMLSDTVAVHARGFCWRPKVWGHCVFSFITGMPLEVRVK